ncbi:MAG: hypothetical protein HDS72_10750 [Bacteroidales bacterium]|nr:hypothetical protein [Bacteroidales bacterium]
MKKVLLIILALLTATSGRGAEFKYKFHSTRLSEALTVLADEHPSLQLNFIYNELDKYRTSAEINTDNPYDALRRIVGHNPVSIVREGERYYLEALQRGRFRYSGLTVDTDGEPMPGVNIMILSPNDSTVLTYGTTDSEGQFEIPCDRKSIMMKLSSPGYQTVFINQPGFAVGKVILPQIPVALHGIAVEADNTILQSDKNAYVPSSQQKKASQNALDLLRRMAIPQLVINPADNAVRDVFGNSVAIFINSHKAENDELQGMKMTDVRKVEYIEFPTDPRFNGEQRVVNFIMAEYEYGGYTKATEDITTLNGFRNISTVFSKFTYRKMTYDIFAGGTNKNHHHLGWDSSEEYHIVSDGQDETVKRRETLGDSHTRSNEYPLTFRASYFSPKFTARNSLSFTHFSAPEQNVGGELTAGPNPENNYSYNRATPNRNNNVQYSGEFWGLLTPNMSLSLTPNFGHTHRNNTSIYESSLMPSVINNSVIENTYHYSLKTNGLIAAGQKSQFTLFLVYSLFNHRLAYNGTYNMEDSFSNSTIGGNVGYRYRNRNLWLRLSAGLSYERNSINSVITHDVAPNLGTSVAWTFRTKNQLSAYINLQSSTPGIDWRVDDVVRSNEYLYLTANPHLKHWNNLNSNLAYNRFHSNALSMAIFSGYDRAFNRVATVYRPFMDGAAVIRTYENNGDFSRFYVGAQINYKLFSNALQLSANVTQNFYRTSGIYDNSLGSFRMQVQAAYYWNAFNVVASYGNPERLLTENSNVVIRRQDFHYVAFGWGNGTWNLQLSARNIFRNSWHASTWTRTAPLYSETRYEYDPSAHRSITLSATYTIGYGKKIQHGDEVGAQSTTPSAILE